MSEEDDIVFTEIKIDDENIIIHMPVEIFNDVYGGKIDEVINPWKEEKENTFKKDDLEPLEILELARKVFQGDNVKDKVVIDISKIEAWKICPTNPHGWCTAHVQGIVVGNVGFFVSLDAINEEIIKRLAKMNDIDKKAFLKSFIQLFESKLEPNQRKPFIEMLKEIIEELE